MPQKPTEKQLLKMSRMRSRLSKQIKNFLDAANLFLPNLEDEDLKASADESFDAPPEESEEPEDVVSLDEEEFYYEAEDESEAPCVLPEAVVLPLPSNIVSEKVRVSIKSLLSTERELRKGQANDALEGLRIGLANKSLLLVTDVNQSKSTKQNTRAWASIRNAQSQILMHAGSYRRAWQALTCIGNSDDLTVYQSLEESDLVVVKDITSAKRFGQGSETLAWFWRIGPSEDMLTGKWMEECESIQMDDKFMFK